MEKRMSRIIEVREVRRSGIEAQGDPAGSWIPISYSEAFLGEPMRSRSSIENNM